MQQTRQKDIKAKGKRHKAKDIDMGSQQNRQKDIGCADVSLNPNCYTVLISNIDSYKDSYSYSYAFNNIADVGFTETTVC